MRTLAEMRTRVRSLLRDPSTNGNWTADEYDTELEVAATTVWDMLMESNRGQKLLRTATAPILQVVDQEWIELPTDLKRVQRIEFRRQTTLHATMTCGAAGTETIGDWTAIDDASLVVVIDEVRRELAGIDLSGAADLDAVATLLQTALRASTGGVETVTWDADSDSKFQFKGYSSTGSLEAAAWGTDISGSGFLNGRVGTATFDVAASVFPWCVVPRGVLDENDGAGGVMSGSTAQFGTSSASPLAWSGDGEDGRIRLAPRSAVVNGIYRVWYYRQPAFPGGDDEKFLYLPDQVAGVIEFLTAAFMKYEEVEDGLPIERYGQMFQARFDAMVGGSGNQTRPAVRYVAAGG